MKSVSSDRIYVWSKRLGVVLLLAMAIVAVGNAKKLSAGKKTGVNVAGLQAVDSGRSRLLARFKHRLLRIYLRTPAFVNLATILRAGAREHKGGPLVSGKATDIFAIACSLPS